MQHENKNKALRVWDLFFFFVRVGVGEGVVGWLDFFVVCLPRQKSLAGMRRNRQFSMRKRKTGGLTKGGALRGRRRRRRRRRRQRLAGADLFAAWKPVVVLRCESKGFSRPSLSIDMQTIPTTLGQTET